MNTSIKHINDLPSIDKMKKISQGLALADAILMPEWEYRYFSFNNNWDGNRNEMMASMRNGAGSEYFINFTKYGAVGKVLSSEFSADTSKTLKPVPDKFSSFKKEPAFNLNNATLFFWHENDSSTWKASPNNLASYPLLGFLANGISTYTDWAENYYQKSINHDVLKDVFTSLTVDTSQLSILNPNLTLESLENDLNEIL